MGIINRAHLIVCVNYQSDDRTVDFVRSLEGLEGRDHLVVAVADNSPVRSDRLAGLDDGSSVLYRHFPHNPGYFGGPRLVLSELVAEHGPLPFRSVTMCNVDLSFQPSDYLAAVEDAEEIDPQRRWVLAPDIREDGLRFRANPHVASRPERVRWSFGHLFRLSYPTYRIYRRLYKWKRTRTENSAADRWPSWKPIYSAHGCFMVFGSGYFTSGGSLPESPLFQEEHAVAEIAHEIGCPTYYVPQLPVRHEGELTTSVVRRRYAMFRQACAFYANWQPSYAIGTMSTWFQAAGETANP